MISRAVLQFAEPEVEMGDGTPHAAVLGERQRLAVVAFSVFDTVRGRDVAQPAGE